MKKTDKLHELIQSMSMSEKRYFKLFVSRHTIGEQNNYIQLFEVLEEMEDYDRELLTQRIESRKISARHLASDKNYLYHLILKGLSAYYSGKTVGQRTREYLNQVEILYERGMYDAGLELLDKAKEQALRYEQYPLLMELSIWERKACLQKGDVAAARAALLKTLDHLAFFDNMQAFNRLYYEMEELFREIPRARQEEDRLKLQQKIAHPFLQSESTPLSFQARLQYWRIYSMYYFAMNDPQGELMANNRLIELMDANESYALEFPGDYVSVNARILYLKRHAPEEEFQEQLALFLSFPEQVKKSRRDLDVQVFTEARKTELVRLLDHGRWDEAEALIPDTLSTLKRVERHLDGRQVFLLSYLIAHTFFVAEKPREALPWVNRMLNEFDEAIHNELYLYARLLNLCLHFDLGNYSILKYESASALRYLQKTKRVYRAETALLRFFSRVAQREEEPDLPLRPLLMECHKEMVALFADPGERTLLNYLDICVWLMARAEAVPIKSERARHPGATTLRVFE